MKASLHHFRSLNCLKSRSYEDQVWKNNILFLWQNFIRSLNESTARQTTRRAPLFWNWSWATALRQRVCFRQPAMCSSMASGAGAVIHIVPFDCGVKVEPARIYFWENDKQYERRWFCGFIYFYFVAPAMLWNYVKIIRNKLQTPEPRTQVIIHAFATSILMGNISYSLTSKNSNYPFKFKIMLKWS